MWDCEWRRPYQRMTNVKQQVHKNFLCRRSLTDYQILKETNNGIIIGYLQCDIEVPEKLRADFAIFSSTFDNLLVRSNDIGTLWKTMLKKENCLNLGKI